MTDDDTETETIPYHNPFSPSDNPNSPFYIHHSDNSHTVVISPPLSGPNFLSWQRSSTLAISIKNKLGFLDGSIPTPPHDDPLYIPWMRYNNIILSWILNSITKKIASNVFYINSAKTVWDKLHTRFSQPDSMRIYQLQQQLGTLIQGTQSVSEYFTHLNGIWEELNNYRPSPYCSCGHCTCKALTTVGETQQADYVFKFLMGLKDSYESIRGQIILMSPIPSLDKTFSLNLQEERQRQTRVMMHPSAESSTMVVSHNISFKKKDKPEMTCSYCGKSSHLQEKCYRLI
ncbi:uncharacterized protein LOC122312758 [Carya illinoinensis]|uniref:uncharacterized protein LOC122312758 n=1 Tax=Carya illinoinensis TaxID=32201 RepID=UPI001C727C99|nr:uncharacterized protein LOC122312758 [Carya illinoinensis]